MIADVANSARKLIIPRGAGPLFPEDEVVRFQIVYRYLGIREPQFTNAVILGSDILFPVVY